MSIQSLSIDGAPVCTLSARELEVLQLIAFGMIDREIADALFLSPRTVQTHVAHILDKLHVATRREAVQYGRERGLLQHDGPPIRLSRCPVCQRNQ